MSEIAVVMLILGFVWLGILTKARIFFLGSVGMMFYLVATHQNLFILIPVLGMAVVLVYMTFAPSGRE